MHMQKLNELINSKNNKNFISRSGFATRCLMAYEAYINGRDSIIITLNQEEFFLAKSLLRLFMPELSSQGALPSETIQNNSCLFLPQITGDHNKLTLANYIASFSSLTKNIAHCIVTDIENIIIKHLPLSFFEKNNITLTKFQDTSPDLIIEKLISWGFERVSMVTTPGDLAKRGDILDIFPPGYTKPIRLEFFGDTIDEIRMFDPESQRSIESLTELNILPITIIPNDNESIKIYEKFHQNLLKNDILDENDVYSLKKNLETNNNICLPGIYFEDATPIDSWLKNNPIYILPDETELLDAIKNKREELINKIESNETNFHQPEKLVLNEETNHIYENYQCIFNESLIMGKSTKGNEYTEKTLHSFSEFFPSKEAQERPWQAISSSLRQEQIKYDQIILSFKSIRNRNKFLKLAEQDNILPLLKLDYNSHGIFALISPFSGGIDISWKNTLILGEDILYPRADKTQRIKSHTFKGLNSFENLKEGDFLVHKDYGIARFAGLHHLTINNVGNDFLLLEYLDNDKLYVPADRLNLIQIFKGSEGFEPVLDRLGSQVWSNSKEKAKKAIEKIAADLMDMYAYRKVAKGFHYDPPNELYHEFEATFSFEETPDQSQAIQDVLNDMDKTEPMDRLICGDVGFGKTEVALRAAFRAAAEGRQVALLCPTTILAEQHYQTFRARLAGFPIHVGLLSRFISKVQQKETLKKTETGQIDILIGTHRLLSKDVIIPNLSLLILDEEQRFGVRHKEKLKTLKKNVDVLTLTATPIPRTLQLSISGIREMSVIETAPQDRKPVSTSILQKNDTAIREILLQEINRQGQVFWVQNKIQGIDDTVNYLKNILPEARIAIAHGQMPEQELENTMHSFWHGDLDILVCTTIIESGLDFPNANTLIIDQAHMFGLGQLYQIRGRVGRSDKQAYAYFIVPANKKLTKNAEERLRIIMDMDYLGAGFQVAMEDLRIRGAGNILGEVQSGHMNRLGLDLYLDMLANAVSHIKNSNIQEFKEPEITLGLAAHIPENYIEDAQIRLQYYKMLSSSQDNTLREEIISSIRDRFGPFPDEFSNFIAILKFKKFLGTLQIKRADIFKDHIRIIWNEGQTAAKPEDILMLVNSCEGAKVFPPSSLQLPLSTNISFVESIEIMQKKLEKIISSQS